MTTFDTFLFIAALLSILMVGSTSPQKNLNLYAIETFFIALATATLGLLRNEPQLYLVAFALVAIKVVAVPLFVSNIITKIEAIDDRGTFLPAPVAMQLSLLLFGAIYFVAAQLPVTRTAGTGWIGACAAASIVLTGLTLMMVRRPAISQIIGFLVIENGIYLIGLTQTQGMPMLVELGILLDVLAAVMVCGMLAFKIQKSFEHIDVTMLSDLRE